MNLYKLKNANKLPVEDLRAIAHFNRIVKNWLKMEKIARRNEEKK